MFDVAKLSPFSETSQAPFSGGAFLAFSRVRLINRKVDCCLRHGYVRSNLSFHWAPHCISGRTQLTFAFPIPSSFLDSMRNHSIAALLLRALSATVAALLVVASPALAQSSTACRDCPLPKEEQWADCLQDSTLSLTFKENHPAINGVRSI